MTLLYSSISCKADKFDPHCALYLSLRVLGQQSSRRITVKWHRIALNPCHHLTAPRAQKTEMRYITHEQAMQLVEAARGYHIETILLVAVSLGLRKGEIYAFPRSTSFCGHHLIVNMNTATAEFPLYEYMKKKSS